MQQNELFKPEEQKQGRKLFANRTMNIALGVMGGIILLGILGAVVFIMV